MAVDGHLGMMALSRVTLASAGFSCCSFVVKLLGLTFPLKLLQQIYLHAEDKELIESAAYWKCSKGEHIRWGCRQSAHFLYIVH